MQRITCEQCDAPQPIDWQAGDLCGHCGSAVREETRCAWCTLWTPQGKFCRNCGCGLVPFNQYGAARMLKNAGVDQLSLPQRLAALDPEQIAHFQRLYQTHLAIVLNRTEELRLCETQLVLRGHTDRLEEQLIKRLPLDEVAQNELRPGPQGPFSNQPERIKEIAEQSPIETTRILASLAWLRCTDFAGDRQAATHYLTIAKNALAHADETIRLEAAIALAHWRNAVPLISLWTSNSIDWQHVATIGRQYLSEPRVKYWAAAAATTVKFQDTLADKNLLAQIGKAAALIEEAKASNDLDMVFTAALRTADVDLIAKFMHGHDKRQTTVAITALALNQATLLAPLIENGPDDLVLTVLRTLKAPINDKLLPALLSRIDTTNKEIKKRIFVQIEEQLDRSQILSLIHQCQSKQDHELFNLLLPAFFPTYPEEIVQTAATLGLFESNRTQWRQLIEATDLPESAIQTFTRGQIPDRLKLFGELTHTMQIRIGKCPAAFYKTLIKLVLEHDNIEVVESAATPLYYYNSKNTQPIFTFNQNDIHAVYQDVNEFIIHLQRLLANKACMQNQWIEGWVNSLLNSYHPDVNDPLVNARQDLLELFLATLVTALDNEQRFFFRKAAAQAIHATHASPECRARLLQDLQQILATQDMDYDIRYNIEKAVERLSGL